MANTVVYEQEVEDFDGGSGEITRSKTSRIKKTNIEPTDEFIKVSKYLNTIFAFHGIPLSLVGISLIIAQRMEWKTNIVYLLKNDKVEIGDMLGVKKRVKKNGQPDTNTIDKLIRDLKKYDVIRATDTRGKYEVNSYLFSTGDIVTTRELQAKFDFEAGQIDTQVVLENAITRETVRKAVTNRKRQQIPGQMSLNLQKGD